MRFYTKQHRHYCGIDLHARTMYLCNLDQAGEVLLHKNIRANPDASLKAVAPTCRPSSSLRRSASDKWRVPSEF